MANFNWEKKILKSIGSVAGVDEAGRGAWAGPVVVAMVILNPQKIISEIDDSKKISPQKRDELASKIKHSALGYSISIISEKIIDHINILQATLLGIRECYKYIYPNPAHLLIDALSLPNLNVAQTKLIKGDEKSYSIAAASILAKTTRDKIMVELSKQHPKYSFNQHKGYGVKTHRESINKYGPCSIHRKTFRPIRDWQSYPSIGYRQ